MKIFFISVVLTLTSSQVFAECINISGKYLSPDNTAEYSKKIIIVQTKCDQLTIISDLLAGNAYSQSNARYQLDGTASAKCMFDLFNNCGSFALVQNGIQKNDPKETEFVNHAQHGFCVYKSTILSKDLDGNLMESFQNITCDDGYTGELPPRIYLKFE